MVKLSEKNQPDNFFARGKLFFNKNKRPALFAAAGLIILFAAIFYFYALKQANEKKKQEAEKKQQQAAADQKERISKASWSRVSLFDDLPVRVSLAMPDYLEGDYRLQKGRGRADFFYVKNPDFSAPLFYVRQSSAANPEKISGEKEIKTACSNYYFSYSASPENSYLGPEKEDFKQALSDLEYIIKLYFKCSP